LFSDRLLLDCRRLFVTLKDQKAPLKPTSPQGFNVLKMISTRSVGPIPV
jgi:hypothetical protein